MRLAKIIALAAPLALFAAATDAALPSAAGRITGEGLLEHIRVLSSDEYCGRAPGSRGEGLTVSTCSTRSASSA